MLKLSQVRKMGNFQAGACVLVTRPRHFFGSTSYFLSPLGVAGSSCIYCAQFCNQPFLWVALVSFAKMLWEIKIWELAGGQSVGKEALSAERVGNAYIYVPIQMHTHTYMYTYLYRHVHIMSLPPILTILTEFFLAFFYFTYTCAFFHNHGSQQYNLIYIICSIL